MIFEVISARQAFEKGLTRYFTGKSCVHGHTAQRMVTSGTCCECLKEKREKWRKQNPTKARKQAREHRARMRATNPVAERERLKRYYERQEAKKTSIAGRSRPEACELCEEIARTVFDHCHATGRFRGWLCDRCNRVLGSVNDDVGLLQKLIGYLEANHGKTDQQAA